MKIVRQKELKGTSRDVKFKEGTSLRYLIASDNMGFSLHKTIIPKGKKGYWHYKHHLESCFCIKGKGVITNLDNGDLHEINVDDCYVLNNNDNHSFEALEDVVLISVFNPPVDGKEIHELDGSYSPSNYYNSLAKQIIQSVNCSRDYKETIKLVEDLLTIKQ